MKTIRPLALLFTLALLGCSTAKNESTVSASPPMGSSTVDASKATDPSSAMIDVHGILGTKRWQLLDLPGYAGPIPTETREPLSLQLQTIEGVEQLLGHAGCNGFSMALGIDGRTLRPGPIRASKMACEHLGFESAYLGVLGKVDGLRMKDGELQFLQGEELVLRYAAVD